jgi:hypothetical protein
MRLTTFSRKTAVKYSEHRPHPRYLTALSTSRSRVSLACGGHLRHLLPLALLLFTGRELVSQPLIVLTASRFFFARVISFFCVCVRGCYEENPQLSSGVGTRSLTFLVGAPLLEFSLVDTRVFRARIIARDAGRACGNVVGRGALMV